jgi:hypothetical protein
VNNDDDEQTTTNIHALNGIRTHGPRVQAIKAYASDRAATVTGERIILKWALRKNDLRMWNGFAWLRIRNGGGHL